MEFKCKYYAHNQPITVYYHGHLNKLFDSEHYTYLLYCFGEKVLEAKVRSFIEDFYLLLYSQWSILECPEDEVMSILIDSDWIGYAADYDCLTPSVFPVKQPCHKCDHCKLYEAWEAIGVEIINDILNLSRPIGFDYTMDDSYNTGVIIASPAQILIPIEYGRTHIPRYPLH